MTSRSGIVAPMAVFERMTIRALISLTEPKLRPEGQHRHVQDLFASYLPRTVSLVHSIFSFSSLPKLLFALPPCPILSNQFVLRHCTVAQIASFAG